MHPEAEPAIPVATFDNPLDLLLTAHGGTLPEEVQVSLVTGIQPNSPAISMEEEFGNILLELQSLAAVDDLSETLAMQECITTPEKPTTVAARNTIVSEQTSNRFYSNNCL